MIKKIILLLIMIMLIAWYLPPLVLGKDMIITEASYYDRESCMKEQVRVYGRVRSLKMANGKELDDEAFTAASWDLALGQRVRITNIKNGRSCICTITDRGPSRRLYRMGRKIDLSRAAFNKIARLEQGTVQVMMETL